MPDIHVGTISGNPPGREGVGTSSVIILPDNPSRYGLTITNISDGTIYLGIGQTATLKAGIVLNSGGGAWSMDDYSYSKEAITAIGHTASLEISYQEFVRG